MPTRFLPSAIKSNATQLTFSTVGSLSTETLNSTSKHLKRGLENIEESKTEQATHSLQDSMALLKQVDHDYKPKLNNITDIAASTMISNPFKSQEQGVSPITNTTAEKSGFEETKVQPTYNSIDKSVLPPMKHSIHLARVRGGGESSYLEYLKKHQVRVTPQV